MTREIAERIEKDCHSVIHYGPVWSKARKAGESFAACDTADDTAILTNHAPSVTCQECRSIMKSSNQLSPGEGK